MLQASTRYAALHDSITSRRRRPVYHHGLDGAASLISTRLRSRSVTPGGLRRQAEAIDRLAPAMRGMSEAALDEAMREARERFVRRRETPDDLRRGLALTREAARRQTGEEAYVVQVMGALALYHGRVIEMLTGEGKTLTGSLVAPLLAWKHRRLTVFTVNDYLARRDAKSREATYRRCLVSVGAIEQDQDPQQRFDIYARSIVYGTPKQITADWLRDQIRLGPAATPWSGRTSQALGGDPLSGPIIPGLRAAMVDEADAVLIDEGVVPLIIAQARRTDEMADAYRATATIASKLDEGPDYRIDHLRRRAELRRRGQERCVQFFQGLSDPIFRAPRRAEELIRQALVARHCYRRGQQYQIVDGRVVIVDEYTGRFLQDRSWEHGLHQAVEAKEGLDVTADRETLARMSFQRFFRSFPFLCGMTGTAADATGEIEHVYSRPVMVIPTNRPVVRATWPTRIFRSSDARWSAVVGSIEAVHAKGRPMLVGTRSIEASEKLSGLLAARGLEHRVLNANFDKDEADLIAEAGRHGAITVATNMAGRGTDIRLDDRALSAGGLHVILTEMHAAKRIDRQFIGRAGRQGDPGSAQIFVSLDDELVRLYLPGLARMAMGSGDELASTPWLRRGLRLAQRRAEARARRSRASVLRQDDWIDKHLPGE